jgi:hypothetical protein
MAGWTTPTYGSGGSAAADHSEAHTGAGPGAAAYDW